MTEERERERVLKCEPKEQRKMRIEEGREEKRNRGLIILIERL